MRLTLTEAIGSIEPRDDQQAFLDEFITKVSTGEFHVPTVETIPSSCIDGRPGGGLRPNAAGGTNSLVVAEDLVNDTQETYEVTYRASLLKILTAGFTIGGHDDDHASYEKSGCGACDRLSDIYSFIATKGDVLRAIAGQLGVSVSDDLHAKIMTNAAVRQNYSSGSRLKAQLFENGGVVDHLRGEHNEVIAVINLRPGTTLDRDALEKEFGQDYEAFNVDVWSFAGGAAILSDNPDAAVTAMVYYNLATAHVLCGPGMQVCVLSQ